MSESPTPEDETGPDLFDLQDWACCQHPDFWCAVKYLHAGPLYRVLHEFWKEQGCPDIQDVIF